MRGFTLTLRALAPVFILVSLLHLALGPNADVLLGAALSADAIGDPVLDSQNRFYGVAFGLYGVLLWICAEDPLGHRRVLRALLLTFAAAGLARCVSVMATGLPSALVLLLLSSELLLPAILLVWLRRLERQDAAAPA